MPSAIQLVWFKRDLRVSDHAPLYEAAQRGPVLPLYIVEPSILHAPDYDPQHWTFVRACLMELRERLSTLGQPLVVRVGEVLDVLQKLRADIPIAAIWAHEETGNALSYARDRSVRRWARETGLPFTEIPTSGVVRRLPTRDGWSKLWEARMAQPITPVPRALRPLSEVGCTIEPGTIPTGTEIGLERDTRTGAQAGGERLAYDTLHSFLYQRGEHYNTDLSSPVTAEAGCSRLSPYLTWGTISIRSVVHAARARQTEVADAREHDASVGNWSRALNAFLQRLHWRDHFVQKIEDEPRIEYASFIPAFDALREHAFNKDYYEAWSLGMTGFPMIDACMRALAHTGWINFRMRAMLVSFASYNLWLDWRKTSLLLARLFIDYEPGIHYSQHQMQSGTTGINTVRIYNPTKQAQDHDPHGVFIRRWIPELGAVPTAYIHAPWLTPGEVQAKCDVRIGRDYPTPIVDHAKTSGFARDQIYGLRQHPEIAEQAAHVFDKHGSRNTNRDNTTRRKKAADKVQLSLWALNDDEQN